MTQHQLAEHPSSPVGSSPASAPRRRPGRWKPLLLFFILAGGLAAAGIAFYPNILSLGKAEGDKGALTYLVGRGPLQVTVTADGNVESASNIEVKCRVAGGSTILWIVEDGKLVEEGEEIV